VDNRTAETLATEIGERLKTARLNANMTQADLASAAGVSRTAIVGAEAGKAHLETLMRIMIALRITSQLDAFLPKQPISPLQLAKLQGKQRQRASSKGSAASTIITHKNNKGGSW
jgi:putative transcriptional regulator